MPAWPLSCPAHVLAIACLHIRSSPPVPCSVRDSRSQLLQRPFPSLFCALVSCWVQPIRGPVGRLEDTRRGKAKAHLTLSLSFSCFFVAFILCSHLLPGTSPQMTPAPSYCPFHPPSCSFDLVVPALGSGKYHLLQTLILGVASPSHFQLFRYVCSWVFPLKTLRSEPPGVSRVYRTHWGVGTGGGARVNGSFHQHLTLPFLTCLLTGCLESENPL